MHFDEATHTYTRNNQVYISVTTLLKKYGLSADYSGIPPHILAQAAAAGNAVHKSLENYILGTNDGSDAVKLLDQYVVNRGIDLKKAKSEELVYDDLYKVAGTVDFQYEDGGENIIAEFKTTSKIHYDAVTWQLSIYNYLINKGDVLAYYFKKLKVFHFTKTNKLTVKDLPLIDFDTVKALLDTHAQGKDQFVYTPVHSIISDTEERILADLITERDKYKEVIQQLETKIDDIVNVVKDKMIKQDIHQHLTDNLIYTYIGPTTRTALDQTKVKEYITAKGDKVEDFMKTTTTKDGIKVSPRNGGKKSETF